MGKDFMLEIIHEAIDDFVNKSLEEGATEDYIKEHLNKDRLSDAFEYLLKTASQDSVETIENIMFEKVLDLRSYDAEFLARQHQKWGKAFVASEALYICVLESAESFAEYVNENYSKETSYLFCALCNIHARALQIYYEIVCLNENGFADAAYARWRSMYELTVVASFIYENGENVAKSFLDAADTDDRYDWARASESLKKFKYKHITFSAIESKCGLPAEKWKDEYNFVNQLVHASPQGTMYRLGGDTSESLPVGRTDWGMSISAIHSALSLSQITAFYFSTFAYGDGTLAILTFQKWVDKISGFYNEVEEECFSSDEHIDK